MSVQGLTVPEPPDFDPIVKLAKRGIRLPFSASELKKRAADDTNFCSVTCTVLALQYGSQVSLVTDATYASQQATYWSLHQGTTYPACIVRPTSAAQVADILLLARATSCSFAAKSGGHAAFSGASSIAGGVTINFADMNTITVSSDQKVASIGPGNRWYDVYSTLALSNLTVIGGRVADVGVGGLTLGGGISFFSNIHGWGLDNVAGYQLVTADGNVLEVTQATYPDLFWAVRGGGNNLGLVTRFDLYAYPQSSTMWGDNLVHPMSSSSALISAMVDFGTRGAVVDNKAALVLSFGWVAYNGAFQFLASTLVEYAEALPDGSDHPEVLNEFYAAPGLISSVAANASLSDITVGWMLGNPSGLYESYWTITTKLDAQLAATVLSIWQEESSKLTDIAYYWPALILQTITAPELSAMSRAGGNALGLDPSSGPLLLVALSVMWGDATASNRVYATCYQIIARIRAAAQEKGLDHPFLYMNYASQWQDPIAGYGAANKARLQQVAQTYDPNGVFQTLQPGYFKLGGPPISGSPTAAR